MINFGPEGIVLKKFLATKTKNEVFGPAVRFCTTLTKSYPLFFPFQFDKIEDLVISILTKKKQKNNFNNHKNYRVLLMSKIKSAFIRSTKIGVLIILFEI